MVLAVCEGGYLFCNQKLVGPAVTAEKLLSHTTSPDFTLHFFPANPPVFLFSFTSLITKIIIIFSHFF